MQVLLENSRSKIDQSTRSAYPINYEMHKPKDVLIADHDKWSNDPSIYNPHEAPTLLSLMLLKEISE